MKWHVEIKLTFPSGEVQLNAHDLTTIRELRGVFAKLIRMAEMLVTPAAETIEDAAGSFAEMQQRRIGRLS